MNETLAFALHSRFSDTKLSRTFLKGENFGARGAKDANFGRRAAQKQLPTTPHGAAYPHTYTHHRTRPPFSQSTHTHSSYIERVGDRQQWKTLLQNSRAFFIAADGQETNLTFSLSPCHAYYINLASCVGRLASAASSSIAERERAKWESSRRKSGAH